MKKNDVILLCVLLSVSLIAFALVSARFGNRGHTVVVTVNGEEYCRLPLDQNTEIWIEGYGGGKNLLVIQDETVCIREATCPDLVCVHTGYADEIKCIVCAPNRVTVSVEP